MKISKSKTIYQHKDDVFVDDYPEVSWDLVDFFLEEIKHGV